MVLGQAPEGARPWLELGMGHEEPDKKNSFMQSHLYPNKNIEIKQSGGTFFTLYLRGIL